MKVFVTGHKGYIGVHLVDLLKQAGHTVTGCDLGLFDGCAWEKTVPADQRLVKDVRNVTLSDLDGHDCIMHLAAISNDPMGEVNAGATYAINRDASIRIADLAKKAGVPRYLFAASCSVYGAGEKLDLDENDPLNILSLPTLNPKLKRNRRSHPLRMITSLQPISAMPPLTDIHRCYGSTLSSTIFLPAPSPPGKSVSCQMDFPGGPLIHCRDIARAFVAFMNAPKEKIHNKAVNVGGNSENYQVRDVGDRVKMLIPSAKITYTGEIGADPRNYRVKFDLLNTLLPDFKLQYDLTSGMEELYRKLVDHGFTKKDWDGDQFVRLRTLKNRLDLLERAA